MFLRLIHSHRGVEGLLYRLDDALLALELRDHGKFFLELLARLVIQVLVLKFLDGRVVAQSLGDNLVPLGGRLDTRLAQGTNLSEAVVLLGKSLHSFGVSLA